MNADKKEINGFNGEINRRRFIKTMGAAAAGAGFSTLFPGIIWIDDAIAAIPASQGYLLVDTKKCQGCASCMLACSLVNEGVADYAHARIQVIQNPFQNWPLDVNIAQCRQCVDPPCVAACPEGALTADAANGYVRQVDLKKCVGCGKCATACPFSPSRSVVVPDNNQKAKACKCDLCAGAIYHWDEVGGGPNGKQACVEVCPMKAMKFTRQIPVQKGDTGYDVNLRDWKWMALGYPMD